MQPDLGARRDFTEEWNPGARRATPAAKELNYVMKKRFASTPIFNSNTTCLHNIIAAHGPAEREKHGMVMKPAS